MDPYNGRNALNGIIKFFTGVDALRQHVPMETRLHGIITHGGDAANVVPGYASAKYYVRAVSKEAVEDTVAVTLRFESSALWNPEVPFRVEVCGTVASPRLPAQKGILALRHAHPTTLIGGSRLNK
jgi:acetylornithine deacetylase/succinyl-diaminopimelate desuccinylase-like protein